MLAMGADGQNNGDRFDPHGGTLAAAGSAREDVKVIGLYSSEDAAGAAIEPLRMRPGFSKKPNGFTVDRYERDEDTRTEGFVDL